MKMAGLCCGSSAVGLSACLVMLFCLSLFNSLRNCHLPSALLFPSELGTSGAVQCCLSVKELGCDSFWTWCFPHSFTCCFMSCRNCSFCLDCWVAFVIETSVDSWDDLVKQKWLLLYCWPSLHNWKGCGWKSIDSSQLGVATVLDQMRAVSFLCVKTACIIRSWALHISWTI